ncbi:hypothetical protein C1H71_02870 [Iodobacter fluviatilis]|uniref:Uncharacterized protein n=1 Tax=Iodobacter fluviatilis TaxID=537 RepID=A0A7G3G5N8_9NEIS|nr:hypothetical protein C1H71_02870 [Iodobacter fluviatilis]
MEAQSIRFSIFDAFTGGKSFDGFAAGATGYRCFMDYAHNVILVDGAGTGKMHLATVLGVRDSQRETVIIRSGLNSARKGQNRAE